MRGTSAFREWYLARIRSHMVLETSGTSRRPSHPRIGSSSPENCLSGGSPWQPHEAFKLRNGTLRYQRTQIMKDWAGGQGRSGGNNSGTEIKSVSGGLFSPVKW